MPGANLTVTKDQDQSGVFAARKGVGEQLREATNQVSDQTNNAASDGATQKPAADSGHGQADDSGKVSTELNKKLGESESREQEIGGRDGLDPTRYGDWEKKGRCIDF